MTTEQTKKLLLFMNKHVIDRHANFITIEDKQSNKIVRFFHSDSTEKSEAQLQAYLNEITL